MFPLPRATHVGIPVLLSEAADRLQVKFMQDLATLRCKQNRQAEAATLLEERKWPERVEKHGT